MTLIYPLLLIILSRKFSNLFFCSFAKLKLVGIIPKKDSQKELIADGLSSILEPDLSKRDSFKQEILEKANRKNYYVIVKRKIESEFKDKIIEFKKKNKISSGIRLIEDSKRYYPFGDFASSVIGFTGVDGQGLSGLENYYDKYLTGESGRIKTAKNAMS